jgi:hypothetical protein
MVGIKQFFLNSTPSTGNEVEMSLVRIYMWLPLWLKKKKRENKKKKEFSFPKTRSLLSLHCQQKAIPFLSSRQNNPFTKILYVCIKPKRKSYFHIVFYLLLLLSFVMDAPVVDAVYLREIDKTRRDLRALISSKSCAPIMLRLA